MSKGIKKIEVLGWRFCNRDTPERDLVIFESATKEHYHVIIDDCFQQNEYHHLTKQQILEKFKIVINIPKII